MYVTAFSVVTVYGYVFKCFPKSSSHVLSQLRLILWIFLLTSQPPLEYTGPGNGRGSDPGRSNFLSDWWGEASTNYRKTNYGLKIPLYFKKKINSKTSILFNIMPFILAFWQCAMESLRLRLQTLLLASPLPVAKLGPFKMCNTDMRPKASKSFFKASNEMINWCSRQ